MAERVDFERLSMHDLYVLRGRKQNTVLAPWQVDLIVRRIEEADLRLIALEKLLDDINTKDLDGDDLEPTYD